MLSTLRSSAEPAETLVRDSTGNQELVAHRALVSLRLAISGFMSLALGFTVDRRTCRLSLQTATTMRSRAARLFQGTVLGIRSHSYHTER